VRLFAAITLEESVRNSIARAIEAFPVEDPPWRWIPEKSLHITLKFLGGQPDDALPAIIESLSIGRLY
jgi:2'-5' RNA ligase